MTAAGDNVKVLPVVRIERPGVDLSQQRVPPECGHSDAFPIVLPAVRTEQMDETTEPLRVPRRDGGPRVLPPVRIPPPAPPFADQARVIEELIKALREASPRLLREGVSAFEHDYFFNALESTAELLRRLAAGGAP
jgi:hypothetical protein